VGQSRAIKSLATIVAVLIAAPVAAQERRYAAEERAKLPADRLYWAYVSYSHVQLCNQERQGYAETYVNDFELQRARTAAKAIEKKLLADDSTINPDKTFAEADKFAREGFTVNEYACRAALDRLIAMSPVSPYQTQRP
jgi:hypothetical protein